MIVFFLPKGAVMPDTNKPFVFCYNNNNGHIVVAGDNANALVAHEFTEKELDGRTSIVVDGRTFIGTETTEEEQEGWDWADYDLDPHYHA